MRISRVPPAVLAPMLALAVSASPGPSDQDEPAKGPKELLGLRYRLVGPPAGGRVSRVAGVPGDPLTYYAATASGGVWKSTDGGIRWKPIFDEQPTSSIGSVAVAPSDPNVVYVGSGEANIRGNVAQGDGIYKSTDAGKTWQHVWKQDGQVGTVVVHPRNPDVAFAAVLGKPFGPNPERGVYRTRDGGRTWERVLGRDSDTGASDVALDPQNPRVVFAGLWQARRRPWELVSGGPGSSLHVSRDGGDTWARLAGKGLPGGLWGKVGVAVAPSDPRRVYALVEADEGGLFRSDDGGETWSRASGHRALRQRAWYYTTLTVDPANPDVVWFPQVRMLKTVDGGRTIRSV
ncbi:MAG TPA: glycosyl hydrolase, partial [Vicinamibacteria bacterium]